MFRLFRPFAGVDLQKLIEYSFMVSVHQDVMIAQRIAEEIVGGGIKTNAYLCTAHVDVVGVFCQGAG